MRHLAIKLSSTKERGFHDHCSNIIMERTGTDEAVLRDLLDKISGEFNSLCTPSTPHTSQIYILFYLGITHYKPFFDQENLIEI